MSTSRTCLSGTWSLARAALPDTPRSSGSPLPTAQSNGVPPAVEVPGNLQIQLGHEDLWLDTPELTNLNHSEWVYVREFVTPEAAGRHFLVFDGIDYFCDVWVNGTWVGHHEGAFSEWELDVSDALRATGERNTVTLAISCPWRVDDRQFYLNPSTVFSVIMKNSEYMKGNLLHYWDGLPLSGNAVFPFGPWRDVWLESRSGVVLRRVTAATRSIEEGWALVDLTFEWWSEHDDATQVSATVDIAPENFVGASAQHDVVAEVGPGNSETTITLSIADPQLWWTWDLGDPNLYRARVDGQGGVQDAVFGIRELVRDPETLAYSLNGQRFFLRGVWYPFANIFGAAPTPEEHWRDVEMLRDGNSNHLVSFTFIEKPAFYDACDRLGMLIFQELPYHQLGPMKVVDPSYPRFEEYWDWSLAEVENIVRRLRGHPSIVVWAAFAETRKNENWVWGDYTAYNDAIGEIVARLDIDAIYHPSFCDFKEEHIWNGGFPFGEFWDHYDRNHHFISEFGAIAPPVVESVLEFMPLGSAWGIEAAREGRVQLPIDVEEYSYRWAFDYAGLTTSVARMYRWSDRRPDTLERFIDAIQWYQAFGLQYCAEVYRRKRFADITGCRTWSYRENIPGIKFTVVDHHQRPKIGYFGLKAGYEPLLLSLDEPTPLKPLAAGSVFARDLWVVNDTPRPFELEIIAELFDAAGSSIDEQRFEASVAADDATILRLEMQLSDEEGAYLLRLRAEENGEQRTTNERWLQVRAPIAANGVRVLLLGQARYNAPILEALGDVPGVTLECVDETTRDPQDSSWSKGLQERVDVIWYAGWDYGAHLFRGEEWTKIAEAVAAGVGFVHTGGQASFHGGDGRGALIDSTPLAAVLPVGLRPHDGVWDQVPDIEPGTTDIGIGFEGFPFRGFSRTTALEGAAVHATIGGYPLLVTGSHGSGRTAVFTASLTKPLRMFRIGEGLDWEDPLDVEPHWARADIRSYGPYWRGTCQLALGLLAAVGAELRADPAELAEALQMPLFEQLLGLGETTLEAAAESVEETRGRVRVRNTGLVVARLARGTVVCGGDVVCDSRFRDGFVDLLPGEEAVLRFEWSGSADAVEIRAQNAPAVRASLSEAVR
jgi:beta-mannosidase